MKKIKIKPDFIDIRGSIIRPIDDIVGKKIKSVSIIISDKSNVIRGNHFHKKEEHFMYILEGEVEYYEKAANNPRAKAKKIKLVSGDLLFTGRMTSHAVVSKKRTIMVYLSTLRRTRSGDYGDTFFDKIA
ncbi:MAG: hypothetical protein UR78_C0024G0008 [Candidatus Moranbacteria bacterium GW2011_GWF2_35_39]|nr:MAG: hypothetical protein UR78_C0024G0008 [Candidatus Moranbacteria bacterium GW2011_GWF2_35_39]